MTEAPSRGPAPGYPGDADASDVQSRVAPRDHWLASALTAVMAFEVLSRATGAEAARFATYGALLAVVLLALPRLGLREAYLLSLSGLLSGLLAWLHPAPLEALALALDQAAFLMAFVLLLGLLHEAAMTSPAIADCGRYLTRQPPGRRFSAIYLGTNVMAVLFNLGVVSLLAPLIRRGIEEATPGDPANPIRERRQLSAMLRGFAWGVVWSPTAVAPLALMSLIPGIERGLWIVMGIGMALVLMLIGWAEDQFTWRHRQRAARASGRWAVTPDFPAGAFARFLVICACLFALTLGSMAVSGESVVFGLMAACPLMLVGWLLAQNGGLGRRAAGLSLARGGEIFRDKLPLSARVAVTLACSGYVGRAGAALVPAAEWAALLGIDAMPGYLFLTALAVAIALFSQFALSPIMMAVFFGSLLGALPSLPAEPTLTALAISSGWALSMTCSPFATVVLMTARATGHSGARLSWGWNLPFSALAILALLPIFWLLTGGR